MLHKSPSSLNRRRRPGRFPSLSLLFLLICSLCADVGLNIIHPSASYAAAPRKSVLSGLPDLSIKLMHDGSDTQKPGQPIIYHVMVCNEGSDAATGLIRVHFSTTGLNFTPLLASSNDSAWNFQNGPGVLDAFYNGSIPAANGSTPTCVGTIDIHLDFLDLSVQRIDATATVFSMFDPNSANDTATSTITFIDSPDLSNRLTHTRGNTFVPGQTVTFSDKICNVKGNLLAGSSVSTTVTVPTGFSDVTASGTSDWKLLVDTATSPSTITATYQGSGLPLNNSQCLPDFIFTGKVAGTASGSLSISSVVTTPDDLNLNNNTATDSVTAQIPDLSVKEIHDGGNTYQIGQTVVYHLQVCNLGSGATNAPTTVTFNVPAGYDNLKVFSVDPGWNINMGSSGGTTPAQITVLYNGFIAGGGLGCLAPIDVVGTLNTAAAPSVVTSVTVDTQGDINTSNNTDSNTIAIAAQPDLNSTLSHTGGNSFTPGQKVNFTDRICNVAGSGAVLPGSQIVVSLIFPSSFTNVQSTSSPDWSFSSDGKNVTYRGNGLPLADNKCLPDISFVAAMNGLSPTGTVFTFSSTVNTQGDANPANNTSTDALNIAFPDLSVNETHDGGNSFQVGQKVTYHLAVCNLGAGPTLGASSLIFVLPPGFENMSLTSSDSNWSFDPPNPSSSPITITGIYKAAIAAASGTTPTCVGTVDVSGTLNSQAAPILDTPVQISVPADTNQANDRDSNSVSLISGPDLTNELTNAGNSLVQPGDTLTFSDKICNAAGSGQVLQGSPVNATITVPKGFTNVTATDTADWKFSVDTATSPSLVTATYRGVALPLNGGDCLATFSFTGNVATDASGALTLSSEVATPSDSDPADNVSTNAVTVVLPDLSIKQTHDGGDAFQFGQQVTYHLEVCNVGSGATTVGTTVTFTIPTGYDNLAATSQETGWQIAVDHTTSPATVTATYAGQLARNVCLNTIDVTGTLTTAAADQVTTQATVATTGDSDSSNNSDSNTISTPPTPDLTISKTHEGGNSFTVGNTMTYKLTVENKPDAGNTTGVITVTDQIPAGFENLKVTTPVGSGWTASLDHTTSPATLTATNHQVLHGDGVLAAITVSGRLTKAGVGSGKVRDTLANTAIVATAGDNNALNDSSTDTIEVGLQPTLSLLKDHRGTASYFVGQKITYLLRVSSDKNAGPVFGDNQLSVTDAIPVGLTDVSAKGKDWKVVVNVKNGRATVSATYSGSFQIAPGTTLSDIEITGKLTAQAVGTFRNAAVLKFPYGVSKLINDGATTVKVKKTPKLPAVGSDPLGQPVPNSLEIFNKQLGKLVISSISVSAPIEQVGILKDGSMNAPTVNQWTGAGLLQDGVQAGGDGNVVIDGHLDRSSGAPAVFWDLHTLKQGQIISIERPGQKTVSYKVDSLRYYTPEKAPDEQIFGDGSRNTLTLITCAGDWVPQRHETTLRLVVSAHQI